MKRAFSMDNPIFVFIGKAVDVIFLGILWLVLCLPIVTAGPASAALYYVMIKNVRRERGMLFKEFFGAFKENFKQGALLTLILVLYCAVGGACVYAAHLMYMNDAVGAIYPALSAGIFAIPLVIALPWLFPLLSRFNANIKTLIKGAFVFGISNLLSTLVLAAGGVLCVLVAFIMPFLFPLLPGVYAFASTFLVERGMRRYNEAHPPKEVPPEAEWQAER